MLCGTARNLQQEKVGGESRKWRAENRTESRERGAEKEEVGAETKSLGRKFLATEIYKIYV